MTKQPFFKNSNCGISDHPVFSKHQSEKMISVTLAMKFHRVVSGSDFEEKAKQDYSALLPGNSLPVDFVVDSGNIPFTNTQQNISCF